MLLIQSVAHAVLGNSASNRKVGLVEEVSWSPVNQIYVVMNEISTIFYML